MTCKEIFVIFIVIVECLLLHTLNFNLFIIFFVLKWRFHVTAVQTGSAAVEYKLQVNTPVWDCIMASLSYWLAVEPCPSVSSSAACLPSNACLQQSLCVLCACVLVLKQLCLCLSNTTGLSQALKPCDFHPECIVLSLPPAPPTQLSLALCACLCF